MKRLLLPLLAALALPTSVNATNYVECEAIYQVIVRQQRLYDKYIETEYRKSLERAQKDFKKRGCYYY